MTVFRRLLAWTAASLGLGAASFLSNVAGSLADVINEWPLSGYFGELWEVAGLGAAVGFVFIVPAWLLLPRWFSPLLVPIVFLGLAVRPQEDWTLLTALAALVPLLAVSFLFRNKGDRPVVVAFVACYALVLSGIAGGLGRLYLGTQNLLEVGPSYLDPQADAAMQAARPAYDSQRMPDIWWVVPDSHPSPAIMDEYGYDWSKHGLMSGAELARFYGEAGFAVDVDALVSVPDTLISFARFLSLTERESQKAVPDSPTDRSRSYVDLYYAKFLRTLKRLGYWTYAETGFARFVHTLPFDRITRTTQAVWPEAGSMAAVALSGTIPVRHRWHEDFSNSLSNLPESAPYKPGGWREKRCRSIIEQFERLRSLKRFGDGPVFVLWHVYLPHGPLWFDADGECYPEAPVVSPEPRHVGDSINWLAHRIVELRRAAEGLAGDRPVHMLVQADEGTPEYTLGGEPPEAPKRIRSDNHILSMSWTTMDPPPWEGPPPPLASAWRSVFNAIADQHLDPFEGEAAPDE